MIDFVITREEIGRRGTIRKFSEKMIIGSDHYSLQSVFRCNPARGAPRQQDKKLNIRSIDDPVTKWLEEINSLHPQRDTIEDE